MTNASRPPFRVLAIVAPVIVAGAAAIGAAVVSYVRADHQNHTRRVANSHEGVLRPGR